MKKGDKCIRKSDVLTIVEKQSQDVKTGITVCFCKDIDGKTIKIPDSDLILLTDDSDGLKKYVCTSEHIDTKVNVSSKETLDYEVQDSKTFLPRDKRQNE